MELNENIKEALETKDVKTVVTALYDARCGDTYGNNIFECIIFGYYCGCGSYSDEDTELIKKVFYYAAENRTEKFKDVIFNKYFGDEDRMAEMMMNILDSVGLVEHGSTMRYPWLTDIGEALYAGLKDLESIEEEYKKENDWYEGRWGFDFSIIDNPYEERKEGDPWIPEVLKSMIDDSDDNVLSVEETNNNIFVIGDFTEDLLKSYFDSNNVGASYFQTPKIVTVKIDKEESDGLNREQRRKLNKRKKQ